MFAVKGRAKQGSLLARLRTAMPGFWLLKPFLTRFAKTTKVVSPVMEILKQKGLEQNSYEICEQLSEELPKHSKVKKPLPRWLPQHLEIQKPTTSLPLLVSSDIIESLFGQFKQILERSPQADMNRTTLLIPALCGNLSANLVTPALNRARHQDLPIWEQENIPIRSERNAKLFSVI